METTRYTKEVELYRTMWTTPDFSRFIGLSLAGEEGDHEPVEPGFCLEGKYQRIPLRGKESQCTHSPSRSVHTAPVAVYTQPQ